MTRGWRPVALALALTLTGLGAVGCECGKIQQKVFIAPPDSSLLPLIESCRAGTPGAGEDCGLVRGAAPAVTCGCAALCRRVLALIDQFSGDEALLECRMYERGGTGGGLDGGVDAGPIPGRPGTIEVDITYRPSTCQ